MVLDWRTYNTNKHLLDNLEIRMSTKCTNIREPLHGELDVLICFDTTVLGSFEV